MASEIFTVLRRRFLMQTFGGHMPVAALEKQAGQFDPLAGRAQARARATALRRLADFTHGFAHRAKFLVRGGPVRAADPC